MIILESRSSILNKERIHEGDRGSVFQLDVVGLLNLLLLLGRLNPFLLGGQTLVVG